MPTDPAQLAALTEANATLSAGFDSIDTHDPGALRRSLTALEASLARSDPAISAGIATLRGWVAYDAGRLDEARKLFVDAYYAGRAIDDEQVASAALDLLIEHGPELEIAPDAVQGWLRTALADADRTSRGRPGRQLDLPGRRPRRRPVNDPERCHADRACKAFDPRPAADRPCRRGRGADVVGARRDGIRAYDTAIAQRTAASGDDDPSWHSCCRTSPARCSTPSTSTR
jgi:hypothetical protein